MGENSGQSNSSATAGSSFGFAGKRANFGALVVMLTILNGCFGLAAAMLRNRIYDDYVGILILVIILANVAVAAFWFVRAPKALPAGEATATPRFSHGGQKNREKRHKRKKSRR